jgi:pimeloyl-ACP methyl ester carboxylesterase
MVNIDAGEVVSDISVPIFFLHGQDDCFTSLSVMKEYVDLNTHAVLRVLPDCGHLAIASHATLFWAEIEEALK